MLTTQLLSNIQQTHTVFPGEHTYALMSHIEKRVLHYIVAKLPAQSKIVEVGSYLGVSAAIMASANPLVEINCFDLFEDEMNPKYGYYQSHHTFLGGKGSFRSVESVRNKWKHFPNIKFHKGNSPFDFTSWTSLIDLYFEDGDHSNPVLNLNVMFWSQFVKPGGYIIFHDYRVKHPDVKIEVDKLLSTNTYSLILQIDSIAVLEKN